MQSLALFLQSRLSWGLLALSGVSLELMALYFQYGLDLAPCVICIYIRVAVFGIVIAGLIGLINPRYFFLRVTSAMVAIAAVVWGFERAVLLQDMQANPMEYQSCDFLPNFPEWMPLHYWLESVFMPTGDCLDKPPAFIGVTMAEWMMVAFSVYLVCFAILLLPLFKRSK